MSEPELRRIISESVKETLTLLGVDVHDPIAMQRDFQHLREWRTAVEQIKQRGVMTAVAIVIAGSFALLWVGIKMALVK